MRLGLDPRPFLARQDICVMSTFCCLPGPLGWPQCNKIEKSIMSRCLPHGRFFSNSAIIPKSPTIAPKRQLDIRHIRENAELYAQNCIDRNYARQSKFPVEIVSLTSQLQALKKTSLAVRQNLKHASRDLQVRSSEGKTVDEADVILAKARALKRELQEAESAECAVATRIEALAASLPNVTSDETPRGNEPTVLVTINEPPASTKVGRSHVDIGTDLGWLDFAAAGTGSGWGWYYLVGEAALLEQALVQYAIEVAIRHGWTLVSPPTMVYSHMAWACGFQPRDQNDEQQIYTVSQSQADKDRGKPEHCLVGTSEISLASMKANTTLAASRLPVKTVAATRCYRAEAGAHGVDTRGLYRVHEFTKVELFAWTLPAWADANEVFDEVLDMQTEILGSLGLYCRLLEMPSSDLGASAARKCDIEAFFPSRQQRNEGWGELSSASICTDYQTRRLGTRLKGAGAKSAYPWTVNGTALAVPRVVAALMEYGWDDSRRRVKIPECLRRWMGGREWMDA
jgi:seryl-tRNA synthetase